MSLFTTLKIVERVLAGVPYQAATSFFLTGGDAIYDCELAFKKTTFLFLAAEVITDEPIPQIPVETREYTPTGLPSTSERGCLLETSLKHGNARLFTVQAKTKGEA